ncbi:MAG TPA: hypothetical protein VD862_04235 [Candidatus Paceibacterota bacterium]|nr:hypothetical protein [Candidatus Paceibacterota bacterium]
MGYAVLALVTFCIHFVWEQAHVGLYTGYERLGSVVPVTVYATLGDVVYTLAAVAFVGLVRGSWSWFVRPGSRDVVALTIAGLGIAVFVEYKAFALGRWAYTEAMPLVGGLGISPLLQMTLLLPLSVVLTGRILRRMRQKMW